MLIIDKILNRTESFHICGYFKDQDQVNTILDMVSCLPYVKSYNHIAAPCPFCDNITLCITITAWGHGRCDRIVKEIAEKMCIEE